MRGRSRGCALRARRRVVPCFAPLRKAIAQLVGTGDFAAGEHTGRKMRGHELLDRRFVSHLRAGLMQQALAGAKPTLIQTPSAMR